MEVSVHVFEESLNKMDTMDLEASWEKSEAVAVDQEVPKEEAAVATIGAVEDWYGDWYLAFQGVADSWRNGTRAMVGPGRNWPPPANGWPSMLFLHSVRVAVIKMRWWQGPECNSGIKDRDASWQIHLRKERTSSRIFRKAVELEIEKRIVRSLTGLREEASDWTLWRGRPSETNEEMSKAQPLEKKDGGTPGPPGTLSGNRAGRVALRREQWE
jgi:hypothetical protein